MLFDLPGVNVPRGYMRYVPSVLVCTNGFTYTGCKGLGILGTSPPFSGGGVEVFAFLTGSLIASSPQGQGWVPFIWG